MKVKELVNYLQNLDEDLEICTTDLNGDVEGIAAFLDKERQIFLVREAKPWIDGDDYYEYWTLKPGNKLVLATKKVFIIW